MLPKINLTAILLVIIFALVIILDFEYKSKKEYKRQNEDLHNVLEVKERNWTTKNGKLVHENTVVKLQSDKIAKQILKQDSTLKELGIKWSRVQSLSKTTIENHYHIEIPITPIKQDSTFAFEWKNNYLEVNGEVDLVKKRITQDYVHKDTITQVIHYKQKRFLGIFPHGPITFLSEVTTADSCSKVTHQTTYVRNK